MTQMSEVADRIGAAPAPFAALIARLWRRQAVAAHPAVTSIMPSGPDPAALVDADMARLAAFADWATLRDDLRARAAATPGRI